MSPAYKYVRNQFLLKKLTVDDLNTLVVRKVITKSEMEEISKL